MPAGGLALPTRRRSGRPLPSRLIYGGRHLGRRLGAKPSLGGSLTVIAREADMTDVRSPFLVGIGPSAAVMAGPHDRPLERRGSGRAHGRGPASREPAPSSRPPRHSDTVHAH